MDTPASHGYTLADLDRLARIAAARGYGGYVLDPTDRYHAAWSAIAEHLAIAGAAAPPQPRELLATGVAAVRDAGQDQRHTWGIGPTWGATRRDTPRWKRYWELTGRPTPSPEAAADDRIALRQIWPHLSLNHRTALYALAVHDGDHQAAAESLGKSLGAFQTQLGRARAAYRALWHEHETPSRMWGQSGTGGQSSVMRTLADRHRKRARRAV